ncbi:MAG: histidinol-phosphate transaminase [Pseudomonadales bacterium]|jgi:histidinol-phosphate aminotransferase|nr:histidinol-phosphate transaminase [Pseudomonadales bacterium]
MSRDPAIAAVLDRARPAVRALEPYRPGKPVEELERELGVREAVKLASNENPRGPGEAVQDAVRRAMGQASRYPDGGGFELKRTLAERLGVTPASITLGNGSNDVLELLARVFVGPGDRGVVDAHAFVVYPLAIASSGGEVVRVPSRNHGHDLPAMAEAIDASTRIVFVANPNNPTGTRVTRDEVEAFLARVPRDVVVVLDEAYFEYVDAPDHPDGLALLPDHPNLVVTRTFSKIHGLAALRVGYAVSAPELADLLNRLRQPFNVNALAQAAAVAALGDEAYVAESRRLNDEGLALFSEAFTARQLPFIPSSANFVTVRVGDAAAVYDALLREGVIVRPVAGYGLPEYLRVSVGLPAENRRFLDALDRVLGIRAA